MDANEIIDFAVAAVSATVETTLANRLDPSITTIKSTKDTHRRLIGLLGRCANTGTLVMRLEGKPTITLDLDMLNDAVVPIPVDIDIPEGEELTLASKSTSGTAAMQVAAFVANK
jgi:hypothetical protein